MTARELDQFIYLLSEYRQAHAGAAVSDVLQQVGYDAEALYEDALERETRQRDSDSREAAECRRYDEHKAKWKDED